MVHIFSRPALPDRCIGRRTGGLTLVLLLGLAGCASVPPPDAAMTQTQALLQSARAAGAADYDPVDLEFAQGRFQQAQAAMAAHKYADAANLAEEARADAELARVKARLGDARAKIQAKTRENDRVRRQIAQLGGGQGAAAPAGAGSSPAPTMLQDMPAPSASVLSAPLPQGTQPPAHPDDQGGQP